MGGAQVQEGNVMGKRLAALTVAVFAVLLGSAPTAMAAPVYENCTQVWLELGRPIYQGEPGYAAHLDSDDDGIGCETKPAGVTAKVPAAPLPASRPGGGHEGRLADTGTGQTTSIALTGAVLLVGGFALLGVRRTRARHRA